MNIQEKFITVLVSKEATTEQSETKAGLPNFRKVATEEIKISSEKLAESLKDFLDNFKPALEKQDEKIGNFKIDEIELSLALNASGGVQLIGKVDVGIEGGIVIKLKRQ
jgi:hypothetical protein